MSSELRDFYNTRKDEVGEYFEFISKLGIDSVKNYDIKVNYREYTINDDLKKILKSNCILILYNFIEGVVSKSIEYIIDNICDNNVTYQELKNEYKKIILKTTDKISKKDFEDRNENLVGYIDIVFEELFELNWNNKEHKKIIMQGGGNIDSRFIVDKLCNKLNISFRRRDDSLLEIKNNRNNLAHGEKSFVEIGQDKTLNDIKKMKTKVFKYLGSYISAIEKYVDNEKYKI